jgi:hypothetical protein
MRTWPLCLPNRECTGHINLSLGVNVMGLSDALGNFSLPEAEYLFYFLFLIGAFLSVHHLRAPVYPRSFLNDVLWLLRVLFAHNFKLSSN